VNNFYRQNSLLLISGRTDYVTGKCTSYRPTIAVNNFIILKDMADLWRFIIYMLAALTVFVFVLLLTTRKRPEKPILRIIVLSVIAVIGGMTFARITFGKGLPWWIFYGIPAFITFVLPPIVLRMKKREFFFYLPVSLMMAPVIHVLFSFLFNWHDYMPLFYIPWWKELI